MRYLILLFLSFTLLTGCGEQSTDNSNDGAVTDSTATTEAEVEPAGPKAPAPVEFPSLDELTISAIVYEVGPNAPTILLCHQARYNKAEYEGTAEKLNEWGFNCVAIDQRSGGPIRDKENETNKRAVEAGLPVDYLDAEQDIRAAVDYTAGRFSGPLVLWGSSYSSTLALYLGVESDKVDAVVSFSPGNYFSEEKGSLIDLLEGFQKPYFVTSSQEEAHELTDLMAKVEPIEHQVQFQPEGKGYHGSKALWEGQPGGEEYWTAMESFLTGLKDYFAKDN